MRALATEPPGRTGTAPASMPPAEAVDSAVTAARRTDNARPDLQDLEPTLGQVAAPLGLHALTGHATHTP
jgi:hypothetical protein